VPDVFPGHAHYQASGGEVGRAGGAAAVRRNVEPIGVHHLDNLGQRRTAVIEHSGRGHRHGHPQRAQPPGQQGRAHRRPADVGGAEHQDAVPTGRSRGFPSHRFAASVAIIGHSPEDIRIHLFLGSVARQFHSKGFRHNHCAHNT
jgi:hypothetical protein